MSTPPYKFKAFPENKGLHEANAGWKRVRERIQLHRFRFTLEFAQRAAADHECIYFKVFTARWCGKSWIRRCYCIVSVDVDDVQWSNRFQRHSENGVMWFTTELKQRHHRNDGRGRSVMQASADLSLSKYRSCYCEGRQQYYCNILDAWKLDCVMITATIVES